jgi:succinate---hydroxymethylglutarate CoA-transferase
VPYRAFKTADGDVLLGGGNDRLFGVLADKLGRPEWKEDSRFTSNALRVQNREELERLITQVTTTKTTNDWLATFDGSGLPYAAVNDVQTTLNHEHGECNSSFFFI